MLPLGNSDCFLAVEEIHRSSASSSSDDNCLLTIILVISVLNNLFIMLFAVSFSAGNRLMHHLFGYQITIIDAQISLNRLVAIRLTSFRILGTQRFFLKELSPQARVLNRVLTLDFEP